LLNYRISFALLVALSALHLAAPPAALAVEVPTLFSAEVALNKKAKNPQEMAYAAALRVVLTRVSGAEFANNAAAVDELFPNPSSYVTQFRPGARSTLWVSFDGRAIEQVLRHAGLTVWGGERPLTLVWLAVDWGNGKREIIAADDPDRSLQQSRSIDRNRLLRERMLEIAEKRGLPIVFPLLDTADLQSVTFSDIWGGFDQRVRDASKRYQANSVLIGRIRPSSSQQNRWTYFFGDDERIWSGTPESVVGRITDLLAAEFAVGGNEPLQMVALIVSGIESVDAYGSVQNILNDVSLIERVRIREVAGDTVSYEVEVRGGANRLRRALRFAGLLEQEGQSFNLQDFDGRTEPDLTFFYNP
jgi:hypothetical protein